MDAYRGEVTEGAATLTMLLREGVRFTAERRELTMRCSVFCVRTFY